MELKSVLVKSDDYYKRKVLLDNLEVPTISKVKRELGQELGSMILATSPEPLKPYLGLTPSLEGAGDELWTSPSDLLVGKVVLKPPLTSKHIKALTHQGILGENLAAWLPQYLFLWRSAEIGREVELKFWNDFELDKQKSLEEQEELLQIIAGIEKQKAVDDTIRHEQEACAKRIEVLKMEFDRLLKEELEALEEALRVVYSRKLVEQKEFLDDEWQKILEASVISTIDRLAEEFVKETRQLEERLIVRFKIEIGKEEVRRKIVAGAEHDRCHETVLQLKHQLECKNLANIMYVICMERHKCQVERALLQQLYEKQTQGLQNRLTEKTTKLQGTKAKLEEKIKNLHLREECVLEIIRQWQKFINYVLKASPTQAEFLLDKEKLLLWEFTQAVAKSKQPERTERLAKTLLDWKCSETNSKELSESLITVNQYHDCGNRLDPPSPPSGTSLKSNEILPAVYFKDRMYVREDFRNMASQGLTVSHSNELWNTDVEHVLEVLKPSKTEIGQTEMKNRHRESVSKNILEEEGKKRKCSVEIITQPYKKENSGGVDTRSSVYFKIKPKDEQQCLEGSQEILSIPFEETTENSFDYTERIQRPSILTSKGLLAIDFKALSEGEKKFPLIGTKCSLENVRTRIRSSGISEAHTLVASLKLNKPSDTKRKLSTASSQTLQKHNMIEDSESDSSGMGILGARDSLIKHRLSLGGGISRDENSKRVSNDMNESSFGKGHANLIYKTQVMSQKPQDSKLSLARDSLIFHKMSLIKGTSNTSIVRKLHVKRDSKGKLIGKDEICLKLERQSGSSSDSSMRILKRSISKYLYWVISNMLVPMTNKGSKLSGRGSKCTECPCAYQPIIPLYNDPTRTVRMSHIEIIESDSIDLKTTSTVSFDCHPEIIYEMESLEQEEVEKKDKPEAKRSTAKVMGDRNATEHLKPSQEFIMDRATSILKILEAHPDLIKIFTSCSR